MFLTDLFTGFFRFIGFGVGGRGGRRLLINGRLFAAFARRRGGFGGRRLFARHFCCGRLARALGAAQ